MIYMVLSMSVDKTFHKSFAFQDFFCTYRLLIFRTMEITESKTGVFKKSAFSLPFNRHLNG